LGTWEPKFFLEHVNGGREITRQNVASHESEGPKREGNVIIARATEARSD
jgi:hypothetical protein